MRRYFDNVQDALANASEGDMIVSFSSASPEGGRDMIITTQHGLNCFEHERGSRLPNMQIEAEKCC